MRYILLFLILPFLGYSQGISYVCGDTTATLTINTIDSSSTTYYTWTSPLGVATEGRTINATEGIWSYYVIDSIGCARSGNHTVFVNPEPTFSIVADTACVDVDQIINAIGVTFGYTYDWDFGVDATPATSTAPSNSVSYSSDGTKTITLTITREFTGFSGGCSGTCTWEVELEIIVNECTIEGLATCSTEP